MFSNQGALDGINGVVNIVINIGYLTCEVKTVDSFVFAQNYLLSLQIVFEV
jgi:hypothetical protein